MAEWELKALGMLHSPVDLFPQQTLTHIHLVALVEIHTQPTHQVGERFRWVAPGVHLIAGYLSYFKLFLCVIHLIEPARKQEEG